MIWNQLTYSIHQKQKVTKRSEEEKDGDYVPSYEEYDYEYYDDTNLTAYIGNF